MGRRPGLKSDEKSKGIPIVLEIVWCEQLFTAEKSASLIRSITLWVGGLQLVLWGLFSLVGGLRKLSDHLRYLYERVVGQVSPGICLGSLWL